MNMNPKHCFKIFKISVGTVLIIMVPTLVPELLLSLSDDSLLDTLGIEIESSLDPGMEPAGGAHPPRRNLQRPPRQTHHLTRDQAFFISF